MNVSQLYEPCPRCGKPMTIPEPIPPGMAEWPKGEKRPLRCPCMYPGTPECEAHERYLERRDVVARKLVDALIALTPEELDRVVAGLVALKNP